VRRRLRITYVSLLAAVLLGLDVPLATTLVAREAQAMFIDRLNDTARFAALAEPALAEPALRAGRLAALRAELRQYDAMFGIAAAVVGRDGRLVLASRDGLDITAAAVRGPIDAALSDRHAGLQRTIWPWQDEPLVVAEPVGRGGEIIGAALTVSPTTVLRAGTGWRLAALAGLSALILLLGTAAAGPLARWMLRPVQRLDDAAGALSEGRFDDRVEIVSGPPELRRLVASFNRMADRVATLVERQRDFVSYASHQLRTPLATLRLCVENLDTAVRPQGLDDYRMMAEEIARLGRMCDSLLAYARAEVTAGEGDDVDAAAVVRQRIDTWRPVAAKAGVRLHHDGPDHARVRAAAQALDQALDALLSNAVKFAGHGAEVVVTVGRAHPGWVDIDVVDNGPGMPPEDLARATEPFWRRPGDQNVDGSGLGVTIADALVTASGGRFDLMAARPHGVHARIRLPAARSPRTAPASEG
jgi:signal transduction histidine kinase